MYLCLNRLVTSLRGQPDGQTEDTNVATPGPFSSSATQIPTPWLGEELCRVRSKGEQSGPRLLQQAPGRDPRLGRCRGAEPGLPALPHRPRVRALKFLHVSNPVVQQRQLQRVTNAYCKQHFQCMPTAWSRERAQEL